MRRILNKIKNLIRKFSYVDLIFYWDDIWLNYIKMHNLENITHNLKRGMDTKSQAYIDNFMLLVKMLPHKSKILMDKDYGWTDEDLALRLEARSLVKNKKITFQDAFLQTNLYGLRGFPHSLLKFIDGKHVIDGGAYVGDTLILLNSMFPQSSIYAFEPQLSTFDKLVINIDKKNISHKTILSNKGLSNKSIKIPLYTGGELDPGATCNEQSTYNKMNSETIQTTTIDETFRDMETQVGLIKLDIEGFEKKAIEGAYGIIKRDKPVVIAAIYHNPVDFFEIKEYLLNIHSDYRFMVRRSEMVIPLADIVLIAY